MERTGRYLKYYTLLYVLTVDSGAIGGRSSALPHRVVATHSCANRPRALNGSSGFTAVHRALLTPALAQKIAFEAVYFDDEDPEQRQTETCVALALTCRALYDPGMDQAWYELEDITRLFVRCFPKGVLSSESERPHSLVSYSRFLRGFIIMYWMRY